MVGVPLNIMCSNKWAMPVMPGFSFELPTCATQPPAMAGSSCRSTINSRMPLDRFFSTTGTFCAGDAHGSAKTIQKARLQLQKYRKCTDLDLLKNSMSATVIRKFRKTKQKAENRKLKLTTDKPDCCSTDVNREKG